MLYENAIYLQRTMPVIKARLRGTMKGGVFLGIQCTNIELVSQSHQIVWGIACSAKRAEGELLWKEFLADDVQKKNVSAWAQEEGQPFVAQPSADSPRNELFAFDQA